MHLNPCLEGKVQPVVHVFERLQINDQDDVSGMAEQGPLSSIKEVRTPAKTVRLNFFRTLKIKQRLAVIRNI